MPPRSRKTDDDSPEVTAEQFGRARPITDVWPAELVEGFVAQQRRRRGPQKAPTKQLISVRLDPDTLAAYKATGRGWQSRMGDDLAKAARKLKKISA